MRPAAAVVLTLALAACSSKPPEEQLVHSMGHAASWVPAIQMTGEKWAENSVPRKFVANTCEAAEKDFRSALEEIGKSHAAEALRARLRRDLAAAAAATEALDAAAERGDRQAAAAAISPLAALHEDLEDARRQYGGGQ